MNKSANANTFSYQNDSFSDFISFLDAHHDSGFIIIFAGPNDADKREATEYLNKKTDFDVQYVSTSALIADTAPQTNENIEQLFKEGENNTLYYFEESENFSGIYANYTQSKVRYATPEIRQLLDQRKQFKGLVILDFKTSDAIDETLLRACDSIMKFDKPESTLGKAIHTLRNFSFHGHSIESERPEKYTG